MSRVHIIGAGLAGLSAALTLSANGRAVRLYEAGPQAGGRCRSYFDRELGCRVDNGNHLLLSGNRAAFAYLDRIGARETIGGPGDPFFPFMDIGSGDRWTLRPNAGRIPWWIFMADRRVPGTHAGDYLALLALKRTRGDATVAEALRPSALTTRLMEPLAIAALNTPLDQGLARLLSAVMDETLGRGGDACIPCFPREGLSESLITPAIARIEAEGGQLRLGCRIAGLQVEDERATALEGPDGTTAVAPEDAVIVAVPPWIAASLLPGLETPDAFETILNVHFRAESVTQADAAVARAGFIGLIGGTAEWVFIKPGHVSVTISAANRMVDQPAEAVAAAVWPDVRAALSLADPMPPWRVVKEKRATFAATAVQERRRPGPRIALRNLFLAGDWTATGLPATIEGAIRSGRIAAEALISA